LAGELGHCHAGANARCFVAQTEVNDEPELAPCFAIALSGCDLRCDFCISGAESWDPGARQLSDAAMLAEQAVHALLGGARSVMILGGDAGAAWAARRRDQSTRVGSRSALRGGGGLSHPGLLPRSLGC
jgi:uncharacterized Fe-S radical SAM superfamily protein PflX